MALNPKQLKFCHHYLTSGNATEAYKLAYSVESDEVAAVNASKLLRNAKVLEIIAGFQKMMQEETKITVESVLKGIHGIATKNGAKDSDKLKAYELLGKYLNMFSDKTPTGALPPVTEQDETERG